MDKLDESQLQTLERAALAARQRAYAPYSTFFVGAALWLKGGRTITGGNVENASYGLSLCAERSVLVAAVAQGIQACDMLAMAVAADAPEMTAPCGACRQVLFELCPSELPIILVNARDGARQTYTVAALLPHAFGANALKRSAL